ncbi:type VI secretion system tube protein Hcp [Variovorax sp.]|uniref:type VI secretion system tube protein Hcp n=1 Tax=Variovorax sp. TaxID=1871043 RepID=UPI002D50FA1C|nr:type VI secretion system tube protein Hcp [Variovorax sp.]HYP84220.1 type VI secretion system tube protein Hcp [Variovorax sp.]
MNLNADAQLDAGEVQRLLDHMSQETGNDYLMLIESKGSAVEGESSRAFEDGKRRMQIGGYSYVAAVQTPPGTAKGQVRMSAVMVVRECDAATATIASLLKNQESDLKVQISVFKASGDSSSDQQPMLEFVLENARITTQAILTGGNPRRPCEIICLTPRKLEIRSAPQQQTGLRGAVRTCTLTQP